MTLFFHIKTDVERKFRQAAMKKYGYAKGALKTALEEAIEEWLAKNQDLLEGNEASSTYDEEQKNREPNPKKPEAKNKPQQ